MNLLFWWLLLLLALWLGPLILSIFSSKFKTWKQSELAEKLREIRRYASLILIALIPSIACQLKFNIWIIFLQVVLALIAMFMILGAKGAPKLD